MARPLVFTSLLIGVLGLFVGCLPGDQTPEAGTAANAAPGLATESADAPPAGASITDDYRQGTPVIGETLSMAPYLAPLTHEGNTTHDVRIDTLAVEATAGPGIYYTAWTFGGSVPGPILHVREGDRIRYTGTNRSDEPIHPASQFRNNPESSPFARRAGDLDPVEAMPALAPAAHAIDFHAATVAPDRTWLSWAPGETIRLEWTARYPGVFTYHNSMPSRTMNTGQGMHGVVVVSPREGYPTDEEVARSYVIVRSELYLAEAARASAQNDTDEDPAGATSSDTDENTGSATPANTGGPSTYRWDHAAAMAGTPSQVVLNGRANLLHDYPLVASRGDRIRLYVINQGPVQTSTFHITGIVFDRIWLGGVPANELRGLQSVTLAPSESAVVEFVVPADGEYTLLFGRMSDENRGADGTLVVQTGQS